MKKLFYLGGVALVLAGVASCSSEIDQPGISGDGNVHFTVKLPAQMRTRAISDGTTASTLTYAVYDKATGELVTLSEDEVNFDATTLTATVDLRLVNGKTYDLVFWADAPGNNFYTFDSTTKSVTIDYTGVSNSDESRDAFFASRSFSVNGPVNETVELYRPFAQVNLGTDDMNTDAVKSAYKNGLGVSLTTTAYSELNLMSGEASGETSVTFAVAPSSQTSSEAFPYNPDASSANPYTWISMDYILVNEEKSVIDTEFTFYDGAIANPQTLPVSNVPVQRNYRTNIYGSLLTSPANLQIVISPAFEEPDYNMEVWNGKTVTTPAVDEQAKTVTVTKPSELAGLAKMVNDGNTLKDYTVTLTSDIDLANYPWTPVGNVSRSSLTGGFAGTFDGGNHKISNLVVNVTGDNYGAGLFGVVRGGTVKNVVFESGSLTSEDHAGSVAGSIVGSGTIENCVNNGVKVKADQAAGGIVGRLYGISNKISGCYNYASVTGKEKVGGIAGIASIGVSEITDCHNEGDVSGGNAGVAGILGYAGKTVSVTGCSNTGNVGVISDRFAGGIVGYNQASEGITIKSSTNSGAVKGQNAGGIFGALGQYQKTDISGCSNTGEVTGVIIAGGVSAILGSGTVENCDNTAKVTATGSNSAAGGVVGRMATATLSNCHGGAAAVSGVFCGRQVGNVTTGNDPKRATLSIPSGDGYANGLGSVGTLGETGGTAIANLKVSAGELVGLPQKHTASNATITIESGASWDAFPGETGTWSYRNSAWVK